MGEGLRLDARGQLFELHTFKSGVSVWMYSDKLHKYYAISNMYGLNIFLQDDFRKIEKIYNKEGYKVS